MNLMKKAIIIYIIWNALVFMIYGVDKLKAKAKARRISESHLVGLAFLMGAFGAALGMLVFHHKTRKVKFTLLIPLAILCNLLLFYIAFVYFS